MKKSHKRRAFTVLWVLLAIGFSLWLFCKPAPFYPQSSSVQVAVQAPPEPSVPLQAEPSAQEETTTVVGEEKTIAPSQTLPLPVESNKIPEISNQSPRIALVIDDVGLDLKNSHRAVLLPSAVTLSFMPYAIRLREQTREAREEGHELLLHMPMEPLGHDNPGPGALLVALSDDEVRSRFETALASFVGFDGVNNHMGSKFTAYAHGMDLVMEELKQRHLFFLDSRTNAKSVGEKEAKSLGVPTLARDVFLDDEIESRAIRGQLEQTERIARRRGYAVAIGHPHDLTLEAIEQWIPEAQKRGIVFVPLNTLISKNMD